MSNPVLSIASAINPSKKKIVYVIKAIALGEYLLSNNSIYKTTSQLNKGDRLLLNENGSYTPAPARYPTGEFEL